METDKVATGGTIKRVGLTSRLVHTFTQSGTFTVHRPTLIRYLVVGGRGGGPTKDVGKPAVEGTELNTVDQEGGVGEVVEGTSTYKLLPGTYTVTVGPRSTEFTTTQIAGTGSDSTYMGTYPNMCDGMYYEGWSGLKRFRVYSSVNRPVAWTARQRTFGTGKPSSIKGIVISQGGTPHPGISTKPTFQSVQYDGLFKGYFNGSWGPQANQSSICISSTGGSYQGPDYRPGYVGMPYGPKGAQMGWIELNTSARTAIEMRDDKSWKPIGTPNVSNQKDSDITGQTVKYGLTPMVIISYDESQAGPAPTTTPPPGSTQADLDRLVKEYEQKMALLQAAAAAEKQALLDQNAAAAQQAKQTQQQLIGDLTVLKHQYDQLKAAAAAAEQELQNTKQGMDQIKVEYDQKMVQLAEAQRKELEAIASQNGAAMEAARIEKERLIAEMKALKIQYDTAVVISQQCPIIPEKTILVDGKTGQMFKYEAGMLRGMSVDTYRALGSPGYTTYKSGSLDNCPRGPDIQHQTVTPKPTDAPTEDPAFPSTVYVIIHGESWSMKGELRVLASRFGGAVIEPFAFKDLAQVFAINSTGYIRSLEGQGLYLTSQDDCLSAVMMKDVPKAGWRLQKTGDSQYGYKLISPCSVSLKAGVADRSPVLEQSAFGDEASDEWYVLPIGKMEL